MATILDKELTRETTVKVDDREILVTLTEDQKISLKLKGMKSGAVDIGIGKLYNQLKGNTPLVELKKPKDETKRVSQSNDDVVISLKELRIYNAIAKLDYSIKAQFEKIILDLLNRNKNEEE